MRRTVVAAVLTLTIAAVVLTVGAATAGAAAVLVERVTVPANATTPVVTRASLSPDRVYQVNAVGEVSLWTADPSGVFQGSAWGVDPLYCYVAWQCATPKLWRSLRVNGVGLDQFGAKAGRVPYSSGHSYSVQRAGVSGPLSLTSADAVAGSAGDNSGSWTVEVYDLGPVGAKVTFALSGYANIVRERPRFQWGTSFFSGRGTLQGTLNGTTAGRQEPRFSDDHSMRTDVTGWAYAASAHGVRKVLVLDVVVVASSSEKNCKVGTVGKVTLVDDNRLLRNGETRDSIVHSYPGAGCPSYVQGVANTDLSHLGPPRGGPGGGQFANVTIKFFPAD